MTSEVQNRPKHLCTEGRPPDELSLFEREEMYRLMSSHFDDVEPADFDRDLMEKSWIITISEAGKRILGFTTVMRLATQIDGKQICALFSGDTVLDLSIWGASSWMRALAAYAEREIQASGFDQVSWLLLTATHRTYRVLPALFHDFYPRPHVEIPPEVKQRLDAFVRIKFADEYDTVTGTVHLKKPTPVRATRHSIASRGLSSPYSRFFATRNPQFLNGDYLACITDLSPSNRTAAGRRLFGMLHANSEGS